MPKKCSQKSLFDAVTAIRQGPPPFRKISMKYSMPVMTIQNRVCGCIDDHAPVGRPTVDSHPSGGVKNLKGQ